MNACRTVAGGLALFLLAAPAAAMAEEPARTIAMTGTGEVSRAPDMATMTAGLVTEAETARAALDANSAAMTGIIEKFRDAGIPATDIRTADFSVQPQYFHERTDDGNRPPRIVGYRVSNQVTVTVRDLDILGRVLDAAVDVGANSISGPMFGLADRRDALDEARRLAAADARAKATLYAEALDIALGDIVSVTESRDPLPPPRPQMRAMAMAEAADAVPIEGGEIELSAEVTVTWKIGD